MQITRLSLLKSSRALLLPLALVSCVTINIYFPAAAAEKAADRIIEDVWGKQPEAGQPAPEQAPEIPAPEPSSLSGAVDVATGLLNLLIPPAHAQEADININTPAIDALRASMKSRHAALELYYTNGAVGLTNDALLAQRDASAVPLNERTKVKQLVADENRDRGALYREIAKANNHPEWEGDIRGTFARQWVENARGGWWYQDAGGAWKQK